MHTRRHLGGRGLGGRGIGQHSSSAGFSPTTALLAAPAAPTLTRTTGATDNTPGFQIDGDLVELDTVRFQYDTHSDFSAPSEITNAIDTAEDAANQLTFSTGTLADGTWYFRARIERPLHFPSLWSDTDTEAIDATAPTLSSPAGASTGETTASLSVSTNEGNGTIYWVVDTNTSTPSKAQVKAGHDQGGNAADDSGSQAVVATGSQPILGGAAGLTADTAYKAYYMHEDAVGNQSTVGASASFTTDAAAFSFAFTDSKVDDGPGTTITYNSGGDPSIGAADPDRIIAVAMYARINTASPPVAVTIGGVSATPVTGAFVHSNSVMSADIWYAAVPLGTTAEVIVQWPTVTQTAAASGIGVYRVVTATAAPTIAKNAAGAADAGANLALPSYTVPVGGASLNVYANRTTLGVAEVSWTNATEDFERNVDRDFSGATVSVAGSVTVTATDPVAVAGGGNEAVAVAAAWGP